MGGFANHFFSRLHLVKVEWKDKNVHCDDPLDGTEQEEMDVYDTYNRRDYGNGNVPSHELVRCVAWMGNGSSESFC